MSYIEPVLSANPNQTRVSERLRFQSAADFDAPLRESPHFVCVPSLGSMVPGWVLISPKRPTFCMADLAPEERDDLRSFFAEVSDEVAQTFGTTLAFEHGARSPGSATGCGVDQAHVHIVPIDFDQFWPEISESQDWHQLASAMPYDIDVPSREYLWVTNGRTAHIAHPAIPTSQFFRRAVARMLKADGKWDYREYAFHEHIAETRQMLSLAAEPPQSRAA